MKKFITTTVIILGLVAVSFGGLSVYAKGRTDSVSTSFNAINPLVKKEALYVKIDNRNAIDKDGYGNFEYDLIGYRKNGKPQRIKFTGMKKLKQGHYLKLTTLGTFVKSYEETFTKDMPKAVVEKIN